MHWINLKKQEPPIGEWVLILTDGGGTFTVRRIAKRFSNDSKDWMLPYYMRQDAKITHWMPLPKPPEE